MKRLIVLLLASIPALYPVRGQNIEGQLIASQYGDWKVQGYAPDTYTFAPTSCRVQGGASFFYAFTVGTPIRIVDGDPTLSETVIPSAVVENNNTCSISIDPVNHHQLPFYLTSATGGLQEAINANSNDPGTNTIILNNAWYQLGGSSSIVADARGAADLGLVDVTTLPSTWYRWNGTQYVVVPVGSDVTSVFGRTGAVIAKNGDYSCPQVTGCGSAAVSGWSGSLTAAEGSGDATASINVIAGFLPAYGYFYVDSEWEYFSGSINLGSGNYTLNNVVRAEYNTTAASHSSGAGTLGQVQALVPNTQPNFSWVGGPAGGEFVAINCPLANSFNAGIIFTVGCPGSSDGFSISPLGTIFSTATNTNELQNLAIGSAAARNPNNNLDLAYTLTHSANILRADLPSVTNSGFGFVNGISGPVKSVVPPNAAAPLLVNNYATPGSTTNTYECVGVDDMENYIIGATASIGSLSSAPFTSGNVGIQCLAIPGAVATQIWRTAGGTGAGLLYTGGNPASTQDGNNALSGTPPSSTTAIPHICAGSFCETSGAGSTPNFACSSGTQGWLYHNLSAVATPFAQVCNGTSWVTAY